MDFWLRTLGVEFFHAQIAGSALLVWAVESANPKRTQTNPKRTPTNPSDPPANPNEPPNESLLGQTYAIEHDSQAFFLKAKAVRKYRYSTVQSALWQSQDKGSAEASTVQCRLHFGRMLIL